MDATYGVSSDWSVGDNAWVVKRVLDKRTVDGKVAYLLEWEPSWELEENLSCGNLIAKYESEQKQNAKSNCGYKDDKASSREGNHQAAASVGKGSEDLRARVGKNTWTIGKRQQPPTPARRLVFAVKSTVAPINDVSMTQQDSTEDDEKKKAGSDVETLNQVEEEPRRYGVQGIDLGKPLDAIINGEPSQKTNMVHQHDERITPVIAATENGSNTTYSTLRFDKNSAEDDMEKASENAQENIPKRMRFDKKYDISFPQYFKQ